MVYAPVIIGTLNRYDHFKRCVESLEKNSWAKYTEIFISVDYPPEEKYKEGHSKIVEYLNNRELNFKEVHLYFQQENLGAGDNFKFLRKLVFKQYDRYMSLEDDMEASPNYIEYMDRALEFGCSNPRIFGVCGFSDTIYKPLGMKGTAFLLQSNSSGAGYYRDKLMERDTVISKQWLDEIVLNSRKIIKIFMKNRQVFYYFFMNYIINHNPVFFRKNGELRGIDIVVQIYMIVNDMYAIVPVKSKLRNWGHDGTGQNCGVKQNVLPRNQEFDEEQEVRFELETDKKINRIIQRKWKKNSYESQNDMCKALLYYFYLRIRHKIK